MEEVMNAGVDTAIPMRKGITGSTLKWIAIIAMFIDHAAAIFLENTLVNMQPSTLAFMTAQEQQQWMAENPAYLKIFIVDMVLREIGRLGFPIFAFLLVEGVVHTRNVWKYLRNMLIFSAVSELPFNLAFNGTLFYSGYQNVFMTLSIGVAVLAVIRCFESKQWKKTYQLLFVLSSLLVGAGSVFLLFQCVFGAVIPAPMFGTEYWVMTAIAAVISLVTFLLAARNWSNEKKNVFTFSSFVAVAGIIIAFLLSTDYASWGVFTIILMYLFRKNKVKCMLIGCISLTVMSFMEICAFFALIPVALYNGKRGSNIKYFFYAFYPAHLTILYLLALAFGVVSFYIY